MSNGRVGRIERGGWKLQWIALGDALTPGGYVPDWAPKPGASRRKTSRSIALTPAGVKVTGEVIEIKERK